MGDSRRKSSSGSFLNIFNDNKPEARDKARGGTAIKQEATVQAVRFMEKIGFGANAAKEVFDEKITLDIYRTVAKSPDCALFLATKDYIEDLISFYYTPDAKEISKDDEAIEEDLVKPILEHMSGVGVADDKRYLLFRSKFVEGYHDLGPQFVAQIGEKVAGKGPRHAPPEQVIHDGKPYPLEGLMAIAAMSKILNDTDWLGGSGGNTGYIIENGRAKAIIIDGGHGLSPEIAVGADSRNIQIGNAIGRDYDIHFDRLSKDQQNEFLGVFNKFLHCENLPALLRFLVEREGAFNSQKDRQGNPIILLDEKQIESRILLLSTNLKKLSETYKEELKAYAEQSNVSKIVPIVEFGILPRIPSEQKTRTEDDRKIALDPVMASAPVRPESPPAVPSGTPKIAERPPKEREASNSCWWPFSGLSRAVLGASLTPSSSERSGSYKPPRRMCG